MSSRSWAGSLFVKLFVAFWAVTFLSFLLGSVVMDLVGFGPPGRGGPPSPSSGPAGFPGPPMPMWWVPVMSGLVISVLASLWLAWHLSQPLRHLDWGLTQMGRGRFDVRLWPLVGQRADEMGHLAHRFDLMAAQLQALTSSRVQLFHDLSHELRSPLGRMKAGMSLWRQQPELFEATVERMEREVARMDALIHELLTLHRIEMGPQVLKRERHDVIELLRHIADDADLEARLRGSRVQITGDESFVATVDGELIYRAIENVVRNALRFTRAGTVVEIGAFVRQQARQPVLIIEVADRGPGASDALLKAMFEPFVRGVAPADGGAANDVTGHGLGLAIAQRAMAAHGGAISARRREGGGLVVCLSLPASARAVLADLSPS